MILSLNIISVNNCESPRDIRMSDVYSDVSLD